MKRLFAVLALALLLSLGVSAVAYADHGTDYARGTVDQQGTDWRFSASSNFNGTDPQGTVRASFRNFDPDAVVTGRVTCLLVAGTHFSIIAEVTDVRGGGGAFSFARSMNLRGTDSGKLQSPPDFFFGFVSSSPATTVCPPPGGGNTVFDGEVIVHDSLT
jgi:opacity protein-like surface antigen